MFLLIVHVNGFFPNLQVEHEKKVRYSHKKTGISNQGNVKCKVKTIK